MDWHEARSFARFLRGSAGGILSKLTAARGNGARRLALIVQPFSWLLKIVRRHDPADGRRLRRFGIRVNALCPGWVDTPFNSPFIAQMGGRAAIEAYVREKVPMGRWADVGEIAEAILFLVSSRSSYMTGQILVVDGGESVV